MGPLLTNVTGMLLMENGSLGFVPGVKKFKKGMVVLLWGVVKVVVAEGVAINMPLTVVFDYLSFFNMARQTTAGLLLVRVDSQKMTEVILHLVSNSIHALGKNGGVIFISDYHRISAIFPSHSREGGNPEALARYPRFPLSRE
jgi:hypothetical protein